MEELEQTYDDILKAERKDRRRLVTILQDVQRKYGYISKEAMLATAHFLGITPGAVYGVATFYNQFRFIPPGKNDVKVCMGTACHLAGGKLVLEAMSRELDLEVGSVSTDREFSLERVACIGCCALAPVVEINDTVYPRMTPPKVEEVLVTIKPPVAGPEGEEQVADG